MSYQKFVEAKEFALLSKQYLCDGIFSDLQNILLSSSGQEYERLVSYYLVDRTRIECFLYDQLIPTVLVDIILDYAEIPKSDKLICWACCGGRLFVNLFYAEFPNPYYVPRPDRHTKHQDMRVCYLCRQKYLIASIWRSGICHWKSESEIWPSSVLKQDIVLKSSKPKPTTWTHIPTTLATTFDSSTESYETFINCGKCLRETIADVRIEFIYQCANLYYRPIYWTRHCWKCLTCGKEDYFNKVDMVYDSTSQF